MMCNRVGVSFYGFPALIKYLVTSFDTVWIAGFTNREYVYLMVMPL